MITCQLKVALELDRMGKNPVEIASAYEEVIAKPDAPLEGFLNLIVLYFQCLDGGYLSYHNLNNKFVEKAGIRINELFSIAETKFGKSPESEFWRCYINYIYLGEPTFTDTCKRLLTTSETLLPYLHLFMESQGKNYKAEMKALYEQVKEGDTERKRYIKSVLESNVYNLFNE